MKSIKPQQASETYLGVVKRLLLECKGFNNYAEFVREFKHCEQRTVSESAFKTRAQQVQEETEVD